MEQDSQYFLQQSWQRSRKHGSFQIVDCKVKEIGQIIKGLTILQGKGKYDIAIIRKKTCLLQVIKYFSF
jgi:hypothetical protein